MQHLVAVNEDASLTFEKYSEIWLRDYCRAEKAESQWKEDANVIRLHLNPAFGAVKLKSLTRSHLTSLKSQLLTATNTVSTSRPYRPKTVNTQIRKNTPEIFSFVHC